MKIFLCDFSSAEYIQVAAELKKRGAEILYWTGSKDKFDEVLKNKENYPQTIFHIVIDAVRAVSPAGISESEFPPPSSDLIREMLECESITLTMMNRVDFNNMPYLQKKCLYYKYLQYWDGMINKLKPDAIIFSDLPHVVYNFVIYSLAKKYGILTIMPVTNSISGFQTLVRDYTKNDARLLEEYQKIKDEKHSPGELRPELKDYYEKIINPRYDATPPFVREHRLRTQRMFTILPKWQSVLRFLKSGALPGATFAYFNSLFAYKKKQVVSFDDEGGLSGLFYLRKIEKTKKIFSREYEELQVAPDFNKKYIYFPLHVQPEATTSPLGGFYVDQLLAARTLAAAIPDDWLLYIKEHPSQWSKFDSRSHLCRYKNYYKELVKLKNAQLIPVGVSTYDLIANARAVATITGTVGWEALPRSKSVLVFGYPWYMNCDGVFRIDGVETCKAAVSKIEGGAKPDPQKVLNYFIAFSRTTIRSNHSLRFQLYKNITSEESIKNITEAIWNELKNNFKD